MPKLRPAQPVVGHFFTEAAASVASMVATPLLLYVWPVIRTYRCVDTLEDKYEI